MTNTNMDDWTSRGPEVKCMAPDLRSQVQACHDPLNNIVSMQNWTLLHIYDLDLIFFLHFQSAKMVPDPENHNL